MSLEEALSLGDSLSSRRDTLLLLEKATGWTQTQLHLYEGPLPPEASRDFLHMLEQQRQHMPVQYILGEWDFMGLPMACGPSVLIPRRDTETLAEHAISFVNGLTGGSEFPSATALDICTGSGCIGIALAYFCHSLHVTAVDVDENALAVAKGNAALNGVSGRMAFVCSDLFSRVEGKFDCITANPPYIPSSEIDSLAEGIRLYEPRLALDGGTDGLCFYRRMIPACGAYLRPAGVVFLEIESSQAEAVTDLLRLHGFANLDVIKDLSGRCRVVRACFAG